jgi:hemoglobin/transferrin/lactoferrin receptor protein
LSGYASWQEGKSTNDLRTPAERWLVRMAPFTASAALRWTAPSKAYWVEGRVVGAVEADRVFAADQVADNQRIPTNGTPAYLVPSMYAGWKATDNLELSLGLENISDSDYRVHGSGNNEAGFNAILGAKVTW